MKTRDEDDVNGPAGDLRPDGTCAYCGSLDPDVLMARLEAGDVTPVPTDKTYKVYVRNAGGAPFQQTYRTDAKPFQGYDSTEHDWVTRDVEETKFYFQHLNDPQKVRFVELDNERKLRLDYPGHFYRLPFFMSIVE